MCSLITFIVVIGLIVFLVYVNRDNDFEPETVEEKRPVKTEEYEFIQWEFSITNSLERKITLGKYIKKVRVDLMERVSEENTLIKYDGILIERKKTRNHITRLINWYVDGVLISDDIISEYHHYEWFVENLKTILYKKLVWIVEQEKKMM